MSYPLHLVVGVAVLCIAVRPIPHQRKETKEWKEINKKRRKVEDRKVKEAKRKRIKGKKNGRILVMVSPDVVTFFTTVW